MTWEVTEAAEDKLHNYRAKRDFETTPEPGEAAAAASNRFVVQEHHASHLHYDFRLQVDGVLKSWAVPKGPPTQPKEKRLAIEVEDHPVAYADFEGVIPEGQYGAGTVKIWDQGIFEPLDGDPAERLAAGKFAFVLKGEQLHGHFALVKTSYSRNSWLLIASGEAGG